MPDKGRLGGVFPAWANDAGTDQYGQYADLTIEGVTQRFRLIKAGRFLMGSPEDEPERGSYGLDETRHEVILTQDYWLADTACTQALWGAVMSNNPARFQSNLNNPVERVNWDDVQTFISTLDQGYTGLQLRLPTEAEWEYACRAGTSTPFSFGENITSEHVNYCGNYPCVGRAKEQHRDKTVPVKSFPRNQWGLYEMHGNVWEWCNDWYGVYPTSKHLIGDPQGASLGAQRLLRGGSYFDGCRNCRSSSRNSREPGCHHRASSIGFRLAMDA